MDNEFRIAEILKERGMTQTDLAGQIGISRVGLSKAINGNTTITTLRKIAAALGVTVPELFAPQPTDTITCPHCGAVLEIREKE
ncbi:helix-turn-helix transcriptional regulator [uncultured Alistipes sp.]|uniref:helix-turn-helix domain-containing protein n=1 Tax=uncultured Alistipes sp. TaxID=538949 RepID=UPI0032087106